ncbi:SRPBCC family protein [Actinacidiphila glaucinigra]|uniref:SRPBCC family protein n=1 Tax=Actinacidiphila glaucinigra TaxID=235986 RepID=UPI00386B5F6C
MNYRTAHEAPTAPHTPGGPGLPRLSAAPPRFAADTAAPPEAVHAALAKDTEGWTAWFDAVTTAVPTATGRTVGLRGGIRFEETVLADEPPRRFAYRADATNAPGLRALLEEWALSPAAAGGTRVRWTFAADGPPALRTFLLMSRPGLGLSFRSAVRSLDRRLAP